MVDGTIDTEEQERRISEFRADLEQYKGTVVTIEDDVTDGCWAEFFADINTKRKEREEWFDSIKAPLNLALKRINLKQHEVCDPLKDIEDAITAARGGWFRIKSARVAEHNEQALANADGGVAIIGQEPAKTVHTAGGASVGLRTQPSWRLTDEPRITAKHVEKNRLKFDRSDLRLKNVPDKAFILQVGMIAALIKTGEMPEGEHSIEKFDDLVSTTR